MRKAASAAELKRLGALEAPRTRAQRRGVIVVPPMTSIEEWESQAAPYQAALIASMADAAEDSQHNARKKP